MKKTYKIVLLLMLFVFLSTYSPNKFDLILEKDSTFFKIRKIIITNNLLIEKNKVNEKLSQIYHKNIFFN